jgi:hypothetical protein
MDMNMDSGEPSGFVPLNDSGVDFHNQTQAFNFLQEILDDSYLQVESNRYARYFWYGIVVFIGLAATSNLTWKAIHQARLVRHVVSPDIDFVPVCPS